MQALVDARLSEALALHSILGSVGLRPETRSTTRIVEYFTGTGLISRWLTLFGDVATVDTKHLPSIPHVKSVTCDALQHGLTQPNSDLIVAHGGLHHLQRPQQKKLVRAFLAAQSSSILLVDVVPLDTTIVNFTPYAVDAAKLPLRIQRSVQRFIDERSCPLLRREGSVISYNGSRQLRSSTSILEIYVDAARPGGHKGSYATLEEWREWMGARRHVFGYLDVPWLFRSVGEARTFTARLFDLPSSLRFDAEEWQSRGWLTTTDSIQIPWTLQFIFTFGRLRM